MDGYEYTEHWMQRLVDRLDRLIEIGERVEGQVRLPSEEESKTVADVLMNDTCIPSDAVADEPPKKWRMLEPGEVVCSGDRVNAKTNPPSDPPNGSGWRAVDASVGTSVCKDDPCIFARPVAEEPAKEAEPDHPAGPKPDPGEWYRLLSKNPPEDLQAGDECYSLISGGWEPSKNAATGNSRQSRFRWYRRKIEPAKSLVELIREPVEPILPKVGDWVRVERPEDWKEWKEPLWQEEMHVYDGKVFQVRGAFETPIGHRVTLHGCDWFFHSGWLSHAEPPEPECREPVLPADAEKECEFSDDNENWDRQPLWYWRGSEYDFAWVSGSGKCYKHARIKKDA